MATFERPFLTARWTELVLLNFPVPTDAITELAPPGTESDLFEGQAFVSIVGFQFRDTRVLGCAWPRHTNFPEINLRYYVRRTVGDELRRGVVFVREIVPRRLIAAVANRFFHENYVCRPMRSAINNNHISYEWRSTRWNRLAARVAGPLVLPHANSLEEFLVEHYWGYTRGRDEATREYRVAHDPWRVAPANDVTWDCDVAANYSTPLAKYLTSQPTNTLFAAGAAVAVYPGKIISCSPAGRGPG